MEDSLLNFILVWGAALIVFLIIDMIWLLFVAKSFYKKQLKSRWNKNPNKKAALLFYGLFVVGLTYFAIYPGLVDLDYRITFFNSVLYGFFTYMTYELTNYSILKKWPVKLVWVDIVWGVILSLNVATITFLLFEIFII